MKKAILAAAVAISAIIAISSIAFLTPSEKINQPTVCKGTAGCFAGKVTAITDGDTIKVEGIPIRLALVSTPELHQTGGIRAREFTLEFCPPGTNAIVDEDDGQREGSFGRTIAVVYCNEMLLNAAILDAKMGTLSTEFCGTSEFTSEDWAQRNGCGNKIDSFAECVAAGNPVMESYPRQCRTQDGKHFVEKIEPPKPSCDPSYPTVCILPPPPDLDCGEITHRNFKVLQPDPHRFDGDKDGIGCES